MEIDGMEVEIDVNMVGLVAAINAIPDVSTFSSCGGHENPKQGQWPRGSFQVSLDIEPNRHGVRGLTILTRAIMDYVTAIDSPESVILTSWYNGDDEDAADDPELLAFDIAGESPATPERLAESIENTLAVLEGD